MRFELTHILLTHHHHDHIAELARLVNLHRRPRCSTTPRARGCPRRDRRSRAWPADRLRRPARSNPCTRPATPPACSSLLVNGRRIHRRHPVQGLGRRRPGARAHDLRRHQATRSWRRSHAPGRDRRTPGHTDPTTVADEWRQRVHARLARPRPRGRQSRAPRLGEPATLILLGHRLRRRRQGVGALAGRRRRHRARVAGAARRRGAGAG